MSCTSTLPVPMYATPRLSAMAGSFPRCAAVPTLRLLPPGSVSAVSPVTRALELVLGELRAQVAAPVRELLGASARGGVHGVIAAAVGSAGHRERVGPAGHVLLELGCRGVELPPEALGHAPNSSSRYGVCSAMRARRSATRWRTA